MNEIIIPILSSTAVNTAIILLAKACISERIKGAIQTEYQKNLETLKAQLKAESETTLERLKSQLQVAAAERQIRYSRVFEGTAETVATTYQKLLVFHDAVRRYTSTITWPESPEKAERRKAVEERSQEFCDYFRPRRIYLPKETSQQIDDFCTRLDCAWLAFKDDLDQADNGYQKTNPDTWLQVREIVQKEAPKLLELLEDHFRELLGIIEHRQYIEQTKADTSPLFASN